ncbi:endolytic transglycosylase MltG [Streptomyces sp. NBC_01267]|uniref:endolytic transglycosylase MltG n=1 Tax=Streptomyces sp. NBC_01267 TaxID=2903805 RepID=UPI002E30E724|nr:endolytic transglycosylase MltG [Streptomyces sp. NBC_01267]
MTEYGRGAGSEPWHPEDPLYGDQGWGGQQDVSGQPAYDGQQQYHQGQQQYDQYGNPVYSQPQDPYQQQYQQGQYPQGQPQQVQPQHGQYQQGPDQFGQQQNQYGQNQYGQNQQQYPQDPYQQQAQPPYDGGWDSGQQSGLPYGVDPSAPYGGQPTHYGGENPDYYPTPDAYPPPQPPGQREEWQQPPAPVEPEPEAEAEPETHPFFTGEESSLGPDDQDEYDDDPAETRQDTRDRRGKSKKPKRRSGCACFVVSAVLVGGLGGVGYFAYSFYQSRYAPLPDYEGTGTSPIQVEVPRGTGTGGIGRLLKEKGVVKSVDAFVDATHKNPKAKVLQAGVYSLNQHMSAANAVMAMVDSKNLNVLIVPPGTRDKQVYSAIDAKLKLKAGTTEGIAKDKADQLGLPSWAKGHKELKDPLEGFLYPASYPVGDGMKPEDILKKMVAQADEAYSKQDLAGAAHKLGLENEFQVITVASLVQAEGKYKNDFDKVARVVYNRLKSNNTETAGRLEFDSTINYMRKQSTLDVGSVDALRKIKDPYNTYDIKGLPPGPIGNPGTDALHSAMNPASGPWYYFVSVTEDKTVFAATNAEQNRNREKYQKQQEQSGQ